MRLNNCLPTLALKKSLEGGGHLWRGGGGGRQLCNQSCDGHHTLYCLYTSICSSLL